jgi:uncharacterized protein YjbJ (UPF0337 family)
MSYSNPNQPAASSSYVAGQSEDPSKISGMMNKAAGAVKENLGHVFGAHEMEQKGAAQRAMGDAEWEAARQKNAAAGVSKQAEGAYKEGYGQTAAQPTTTASGTAERLAGEAQERWNK